MNITKEELIKILGLGEDATDEQIVTAIKAGAQAIEEIAKKRADDDDDTAALSAAVKEAVAAAVKPIEEKVAALSAAAVAHEKADLIAEAAREGKVVALSADALAKISVDDLKATIAKTAVTVPLSARTPTNLPAEAGRSDIPDDFRQIALNCGASPEIFKK